MNRAASRATPTNAVFHRRRLASIVSTHTHTHRQTDGRISPAASLKACSHHTELSPTDLNCSDTVVRITTSLVEFDIIFSVH